MIHHDSLRSCSRKNGGTACATANIWSTNSRGSPQGFPCRSTGIPVDKYDGLVRFRRAERCPTCSLQYARRGGSRNERALSTTLRGLGPDAFTQYDNTSHQLGTDMRIRWAFRPNGDFFLTYNHNIDVPLGARAWTFDSNRLSTKVQYALRY